ncbi:hypothetical protein EDD11_000117 [Mortierella claussenii]|nr:hypothetical protein EDD11_000117 [Mortierella claussenii]
MQYFIHRAHQLCDNHVFLVDDDLGLEPCSMWSSFVHAALHYTRLVWDLSPVGQKTQVSVHVAPGAATALDSIVLNGWLLEEQRLGNLTSQLKKLQSQDDMTSKRTDEDDSSLREWIKQALKGAIAHVLEPAPQQTVSNGSGGFQHRLLANIIMVLVDREGSIKKEGEDTEMNDEENQAWNYSGMDLRSILTEALHSLQECVRNSRVSNINVEFIRISTQLKKVHADIVREDISRVCSASVYTVAAENETSTTRALTNHYLLQNKNIQSLRLRNLPLGDGDSSDPIDLFYRTDHITALALKKVDKHPQAMPTALLQDTPRTVLEATELRYGVECDKTSWDDLRV